MIGYTNESDKNGYVKFANNYSNFISVDIGAWVSLKSSDLGLVWDIVNNLPLQSHNYQYKFHEDLSLLSLLFKPKLIYQAVDIVFGSIKIINGYPSKVKKGDVIVHSKRGLFDAIMQNRKNIYAVYPKNKAKSADHLMFCLELEEYKEKVIKRIVYRNAMRKFKDIFEILSSK